MQRGWFQGRWHHLRRAQWELDPSSKSAVIVAIIAGNISWTIVRLKTVSAWAVIVAVVAIANIAATAIDSAIWTTSSAWALLTSAETAKAVITLTAQAAVAAAVHNVATQGQCSSIIHFANVP